MKRIGVMIPAITDRMQSEMLESIFHTASAAGFDVIVLTTATSGMDFHMQSDMMEGEENIFTLLDTVRLDGVLLVSQYFWKETVRRMLSEKIRRANIPCVDLGGTALGFASVAIPQEEAFYALTNHVIEQHHCRHLLFLGGPQGNPDSEQRLQGFRRAAEMHHCQTETVYGDFWKARAAELGTELIRRERTMPDAILCANDVMAVTLCDTLKTGGISVPEDVIVTGYDGQLCALSHFPSVTTVSGGMAALGRNGTARLIELIGDTVPLPEGDGMQILYGASCGCAERMADYRTAALQVQEHIRQEADAAERLEMRINADIITRAACVESLAELTALIDQSAHILQGFRSLHLCLCADWEGDLQHPEEYRIRGYSRQMLCVITKDAGMPGRDDGRFPTKQILPLLSEPHEPVLVFLLPLHASVQAFGYCALVYENAAEFTITILLVNMLSAMASGLRTIRQKHYAEYLQKQIEDASLYDKMTDMLSKKGLLLHLEQQPPYKHGILLVKIGKLSGAPFGQDHRDMSDAVIRSELLLANAIRLLTGREMQSARLDRQTFAVLFPLTEAQTPEQYAEEWMMQLDVLLRKMQEGTASAFLLEPCYVCGICETPAEPCLNALWEKLNRPQQKENGFIGISQLQKLRREMHKAPGLNWSLEEFAKRLHISKSYVQKLYQKHFGISYKDDLIETRIALAQKLLTTTDLSVSEIAAACGYQNPTHFMRQFKDRTGMTPTAFRKQ